ncbi:MAG TPA: hypothetical protein VHJ59_02655 [Nitrososphaera sp.]|nr:hypothetical protein [Nitrososphaera sp.]
MKNPRDQSGNTYEKNGNSAEDYNNDTAHSENMMTCITIISHKNNIHNFLEKSTFEIQKRGRKYVYTFDEIISTLPSKYCALSSLARALSPGLVFQGER